MNGQQTFSDIEYSMRKRTTKREAFLDAMDECIVWDEWCALIEPYYFKGKRGRPPMGIEKMLRMYLLQVWFNLSDEGVEEAIYDSYAFRKFMGINFTECQVPDATTLLHFRRIIEDNKIGEKLFAALNKAFEEAGFIWRGGTIVDAAIIAAPSSTKNKSGKRDPEMHQTKKGSQWYFGMKAHIGVDAGTGMVHTVEVTPANVHDVDMAEKLIREDDDVVYGDSGYLGLQKRPEIRDNKNKAMIDFRINRRPSQVKTSDTYAGINWEKKIEHDKSSVRCKVEHPFLAVKRTFGYRKVAYKGLEKNRNRLLFLFSCSNILMYLRGTRRVPMPLVG
ncbi:MAG: IS5 family transposase [Oscillospiraceae bacterium]|nr:IS5 family transposase [Oscillospiraceae bacterium]